MYTSCGDKMLLRKLSITPFSKYRNLNQKKNNVKKSNNKVIYYPIDNKTKFEKFNINVNRLKPTHSGGGKIIQPGGGYKGN